MQAASCRPEGAEIINWPENTPICIAAETDNLGHAVTVGPWLAVTKSHGDGKTGGDRFGDLKARSDTPSEMGPTRSREFRSTCHP